MSTDTAIKNWLLETDKADVAWLGINTPGSTNVLSRDALLELEQFVDAFEQRPPAALIIYSPKDSGFIAGADIREFPRLRDEAQACEEVRRGQRVFDRLAQLDVTTVAALNGVTLGGGLELALACDYRISLPSDRPTLGLPEIQLGVHPGLGGIVRSIRLAGVRAAMPWILTGKAIRPKAALKAGLIDAICEPDDWRRVAREYAARDKPDRQAPLLDRLLGSGPLRPLMAGVLARQVRGKANPAHYPAPYAVIDLWREHGCADSGLDAEARSFARLVFSPTSKNLQRVFFLQDRMKELAKQTSMEFSHVHVVGAGTMGADIAAWCALQGMSVTLQDRETPFIEAGLQRARETLTRKLKIAERIDEAAARLVADLTGEGAHSADLIIEAIFEDLEAKQTLFKRMEAKARPEALLATNTSSIPLEEIATALKDPGRLIGLHFFNPVALMPLVEVVHATGTDTDAVNNGLGFVKRIGKLPLPCRSLPGFLVNRILAPYLDEACRLYDEGVQAEVIDRAATDFGMPVGPLELADSVGLDILVHVAGILGDTIGRSVPEALTQRNSQGNLGRKSGEGFYRWENDKPVKSKAQQDADTPDIQERMIASLLNEAANCVAAEVVADADLVDAGTIFGAGFAPFRGGPLQHARSTGIDATCRELERLAARYGERFKPSPGWKILAADADSET